jgi:hypothetical protein
MKLTKARKGDEVIVHFDDHVEDGDGPLRCLVRGKLIKKGPKYVTIEAWTCIADAQTNDSNHKTYTILTSTIVGYSVLTPRWEGEPP